MNGLYGGIEAGGTKFVCAVGTANGEILAETRFPTTNPRETLGRAADFFEQQNAESGPLNAIGIAAFGPLDPDPASPTWGHITTTPKPGWANTDIVAPLRARLDVAYGFDTDVNGAALGEWRWGAAQGLDSFIYLTVGTGIGGGLFRGGGLQHGLVHPEMGHIRIPRRANDPYEGHCPYHGDCLEGLASGPAIADRWGRPGTELAADHPAWKLEADYLALALVNFICTVSPQRIIMGGGVMEQKQLFPLIRRRVQELLNGYIQHKAILDDIDRFIVPPGLGARAGVLGAIALGLAAA